ncbi:MAG: radical SAM protein [Elusimicrobia bacterium]|nr:radical SAM protein [Elusimicrobiota bacterium]
MELYLVLSDQCNFSCSHCLNSSGPADSKFRLSKKEFDELVPLVNQNKKYFPINIVHFSGGEPTLHVELIQQFQSRITRPVHYAITTNAWFGKEPDKMLDAIHLDKIVVSYDKYHRPFIDKSTVKSAIEAAIKRKIPVILNFVYSELSDLAEAGDVLAEGCVFKPSRLIQCGKMRKLPEETQKFILKDALETRCPSLVDRKSGEEKVMYIPGKGFTPCCGPLVFDQLANEEFIFSRNADDYQKNTLRQIMTSDNFNGQITKTGLAIPEQGFHNLCDACVYVHARQTALGLGSKHELALRVKKEGAVWLPIADGQRLALVRERVLGQNFKLSYIYMGDVTQIHADYPGPNGYLGIKIKSFSKRLIPDFFKLLAKIYINAYLSEFPTDAEQSKFRQTFFEYASKHRPFGTLYYKGKNIVGAFLLNRYSPHPVLKQNTLHVGFLGYDRDRLSPDEVKNIKQDWLAIMRRSRRGEEKISSSIYSFNEPSHTYHLKLGLKPLFLKIERKSL